MYLYNSATHKKEEFKTHTPGHVEMYTCGPTVYHYAHIGNLRSYIMEDVLEKYLRWAGYDVHRVMNITDVGHLTSDADEGEDKMVKGAKREHKSVMEIAKFYTDAFFADCEKLHIRKPDTVVPATTRVPDFIHMVETLLEKGYAYEAGGNVYFDTSKLENYGSINPVYQGQFYDPENKYTVPYGAGVQTIVYDPSAVDVEIKGYADLWDASLEDNLGIIDNFRVVNGMALKVLGESYNTEDTAAIEAAGDKLLELAPNIRLIKDQNTQDDLLSGEVGAAVLYTSQATMAKMANPELEVVFPEEGIGFGIMAQFIPANAPNAENAYKFIDYILQPEVAAQCFEYIGYYCTNLDAEEYISEEYRDFLTLPADIDASSMEMIENVSAEALETHSRVYTEFKTACGQ